MKLVAAAKVRRAQEAVVNGRPFSENLVKVRRSCALSCLHSTSPQVLYGVNLRLRDEDVDSPLTSIRPVKRVSLICLTGDRGLCGGYNNFVIKKAGTCMVSRACHIIDSRWKSDIRSSRLLGLMSS